MKDLRAALMEKDRAISMNRESERMRGEEEKREPDDGRRQEIRQR
jgi:hypothetical protein